MEIAHLRPDQMLEIAVAIPASYLLALPLGWERKGRGTPHVGLRTLPLVSVGTCAYLLISRFLEERGIFDADGRARALRAMMTGIGFIGGGAILKQASSVKGVAGLTTGATVWTTGAVGASVAYGYYTLGIALCLMHLFITYVTDVLGRRARAALDDDA